MSLNKNVVVSFVVIGLLLCTTPAMMDESDASVSERFTENYLYYAQFEKQSIPYDDWYYDDYLYYIDGSEKDKQMGLYISDPQRYSISSSDDRKLITSSPAGTLVNVYMCSNYYSEDYTQTISYNEQEKNATKILDPYGGVSFFVRAGDTLEITVNSLTLSNGTNTPRAYISVDYDQVYLNPSFSHVIRPRQRSTWISITSTQPFTWISTTTWRASALPTVQQRYISQSVLLSP